MNEKNYMGMDGFIWWMGVVESRQDPLKLGRCQVRFFGYHSDSLTDIPSADLPWATPAHSLNNHTFSTPKETDVVFGFFADGNSRQMPIMIGIIPGIETNPPSTGTGYHDLRANNVIAAAPKVPAARTYVSDGSGVKIKELDTTNPSVVSSLRYPRATDLGNNSITGLTRGVLLPTDVMQSRLNESYPKITSANKVTFQEPKPIYSPVYPYNQALATESGHSLEFEDTQGKERITISHRTGTFTEYYPTGSKIEEIVKNNYKVVFADDFIHVMGHVVVAVDSDVFIKANGDIWIEGGNDMNVAVSGTMNLSVGEALNIKAKSLNIDIAQDATLITGGDQYFSPAGDFNLDSATGSIYLTTEVGQIEVSATDSFDVTAADIGLNSGTPAGLATPGKTVNLSSPAPRAKKNDNPIGNN
jgi:hypothetical protein